MNPLYAVNMGKQLLCFATVHPYPVQRIEVGFRVAFREKEYGRTVTCPCEIRDIDIAGHVGLRVTFQVGDVQFLVRQPVRILVDFTRHLQQVGNLFARRTHACGPYLFQGVDVFEC